MLLLTLTFFAVENQSRVSANDAPEITGIQITSSPAVDDTYGFGETIEFQATFDEDVLVTGTPQLEITVGDAARTADYSRSAGAAVVFSYTVADGDTDSDGISVESNKLSLNGGTIQDGDGNDAVLTHDALTANPLHKVHGSDSTAPTVLSLAITSDPGVDEIYVAGDVIKVTVTFSENVVVTGTPQLELDFSSDETRQADFSSADGASVVFSYTVVTVDTTATQGIFVAENKLSLNGGTIKDAADNAADLTHEALPHQLNHRVDGLDTRYPNVLSLAVTSDAGEDHTYETGEVIEITVTFDENVVVTGTPQLEIQVGDAARTADYSISTGALVVFSYTVAEGDTDSDGISIGLSKLSLNGGTIKDAADNDAILGHPILAAQSNHKVAGSDTTAPTVSSLAITSDAGEDDTYDTGDVIEVTVTFSESVVVTGAPQLGIDIGGSAKTAAYSSASGAAVTFSYTVAEGDTASDGIAIGANKLSLNGGTIKDAADNDAILGHAALAAQSNHKVVGSDTTAPTVSSLTIISNPGDDNTYVTGDDIEFAVIFSENVIVTGAPQLEILVGGAIRTASYASAADAAVTFRYTVAAGDNDSDGIAIGANKLSLNGGTIKDAADNAASLTHDELIDRSAHKVDTAAPTISSLAITSSGEDDDTYGVGDVIEVTVTFGENVTVTGAPQLEIDIGGVAKTAAYANSAGAAVTFSYTVAVGDADSDGISVGANKLSLNGGTINDAAGNAADLSHEALATQSGHKVDAPGGL